MPADEGLCVRFWLHAKTTLAPGLGETPEAIAGGEMGLWELKQ
jgi:hypothetical protein